MLAELIRRSRLCCWLFLPGLNMGHMVAYRVGARRPVPPDKLGLHYVMHAGHEALRGSGCTPGARYPAPWSAPAASCPPPSPTPPERPFDAFPSSSSVELKFVVPFASIDRVMGPNRSPVSSMAPMRTVPGRSERVDDPHETLLRGISRVDQGKAVLLLRKRRLALEREECNAQHPAKRERPEE